MSLNREGTVKALMSSSFYCIERSASRTAAGLFRFAGSGLRDVGSSSHGLDEESRHRIREGAAHFK
jgi:hypothetical protein